jgi:hypothetical protein
LAKGSDRKGVSEDRRDLGDGGLLEHVGVIAANRFDPDLADEFSPAQGRVVEKFTRLGLVGRADQ